MFSIKYKVKQEDINHGGHVGNERSLVFFQNVREEFLKSINLSEGNIGEFVGMIQRNAYIDYKKELFLDNEIEIRITSIVVDRVAFKIEYLVSTSENIVAIEGYTTMLAYDYDKKKVVKVPLEFKNKVSA